MTKEIEILDSKISMVSHSNLLVRLSLMQELSIVEYNILEIKKAMIIAVSTDHWSNLQTLVLDQIEP